MSLFEGRYLMIVYITPTLHLFEVCMGFLIKVSLRDTPSRLSQYIPTDFLLTLDMGLGKSVRLSQYIPTDFLQTQNISNKRYSAEG